MFARFSADKLANASKDTTKFNSVPIEIDTWCLYFTQQLEEKRFRVCDKNFKVLTDALLIDAISGH